MIWHDICSDVTCPRLQDEAPPSGGGVPVRQHAVIVFHREASAVAALAADGSPVLGAPVRVQVRPAYSNWENPF
jgi:hypothetical protein